MKDSPGGFTLLELVIASSIMALVLGITMQVYLTGSDCYEQGDDTIWTQTKLQLAFEKVVCELMETSEQNLTIYSWADAILGNQDVLCFPSARDSQDNFIVDKGKPVWQSVVVYATYPNPNHNNAGEIRRYENFGAHTLPLNVINITTTTIFLSDGTAFARDSGKTILSDIAGVDAQALHISPVNPISLRIDAKVALPKGGFITIPLQTAVNCRN